MSIKECKTKIALFIPSLGSGGAERVVIDLAGYLVKEGLVVDLIVGKAEGPLQKDIPEMVRVVDLRARRALTSLSGLMGYLKAERPRVMLSTPCHSNIIAVWARWLAGIDVKLILREANTPSWRLKAQFSLRHRVLAWLMKRNYRLADGVVAVSIGVRDDLISFIGLSKDMVHVINNPIDIPNIREKALEAIDHPWFQGGIVPVILAVGRLAQQKDYSTLIRAFAELRKECDARLVILGEGAERGRLENLSKELGVGQDVGLPGFVKNPFAYMARASLFVLSSRYEGFPNVLAQALACGCPVVSTDCPSGPREILQGGVQGVLVKMGDAHDMAGAMLAQLRDPRPKVNAPIEFVNRYSQKNVTNQYLKLILTVLNNS